MLQNIKKVDFYKYWVMVIISFLSSLSYAMMSSSQIENQYNFSNGDFSSISIKADISNIKIQPCQAHQEPSVKITGSCQTIGNISNGNLSFEKEDPAFSNCIANYEVFIPKDTPVSITSGSSKVSISDMGHLRIKAGTLDIAAQNIASSELNCGSGTINFENNILPQKESHHLIKTAKGTASFIFPDSSSIKAAFIRDNALHPELIQRNFDLSTGSSNHFSVHMVSSQGALELRKFHH